MFDEISMLFSGAYSLIKRSSCSNYKIFKWLFSAKLHLRNVYMVVKEDIGNRQPVTDT